MILNYDGAQARIKKGKMMTQSKIAIVGMNDIGSACAFALLLKNYAGELLLVDLDEKKTTIELLDLSDALFASSTSLIKKSNFTQAAQADIIIITAQDSQELSPNKKMMDDIFFRLTPLNPKAIIIIASEPMDLLTLYVQNKNLLPRNQIFGTGTLLDTTRLQLILGEKLNVSPLSIHGGYILGASGQSQFATWSSIMYDGKPVGSLAKITGEDLSNFEIRVKKRADEISSYKPPIFGIAACICLLCETIIFDKKKIFPLSCYYEPFKVCLSLPCQLGATGIEKIINAFLSPEEKNLLTQSAKKMQHIIASQ
jgi:L-lactate dehydrogenase